MLKFTQTTERFIKRNLQKGNYDIDKMIDEANKKRAMASSEDLRQEYIMIKDELSIIKNRKISVLNFV